MTDKKERIYTKGLITGAAISLGKNQTIREPNIYVHIDCGITEYNGVVFASLACDRRHRNCVDADDFIRGCTAIAGVEHFADLPGKYVYVERLAGSENSVRSIKSVEFPDYVFVDGDRCYT